MISRNIWVIYGLYLEAGMVEKEVAGLRTRACLPAGFEDLDTSRSSHSATRVKYNDTPYSRKIINIRYFPIVDRQRCADRPP